MVTVKRIAIIVIVGLSLLGLASCGDMGERDYSTYPVACTDAPKDQITLTPHFSPSKDTTVDSDGQGHLSPSLTPECMRVEWHFRSGNPFGKTHYVDVGLFKRVGD